MSEQYGNAAQTQLNANALAGDASILVLFNTGFPASGAGQFRALISNSGGGGEEVVLVTQVSGVSFSVTRAIEPYSGNAAAAAHSSGSFVTQIITASGLANNPRSMVATGDIEYLNAAGNPTRLSIGTQNQVLLVSGILPMWATSPYLNSLTQRIFGGL